MNPSEKVRDLINAELWSVVAGEGTGSVLMLGFGGKIPRSRPLKNSFLSEEQRLFDAEFGLIIYSAWRFSKDGNVLFGWRDYLKNDGKELTYLKSLAGCTVVSVEICDVSYDMRLKFSNHVIMDIFCDITNELDGDENYLMCWPEKTISVGIRSKIESSSRSNSS